MQIVDWYMANERDPHREAKGGWAWTLLLQSIMTAISCRYQAYLWDNRELISHINAILCDLIADMVKEKNIPLTWKASRVMEKRGFEYGQTDNP